MTPPSASIVLLNYNTRDLTIACLDRLLPDTATQGWQLIVVDNASNDGSADAIAARFPTVEIIRSDVNRGFAAGNNLGIRHATGDALLLLNSDVIATHAQLATLISYLHRHTQVAAVSAGLRTADGLAQAFAYGDDPSPTYLLRRGLGRLWGNHALHNWDITAPLAVDWVSGACLCVRRQAIEQVGLLDETFFLYFEDADWCRRMRQAGWKIIYNPTVQVTHLGGSSQPRREIANRHYHTSLLLYYRKHYSCAATFLIRMAVTVARIGRHIGPSRY